MELYLRKINHLYLRLRISIKKHWFLYLLVLPSVIYVFIFRYVPIYGLLIAFKDYSIRKGILGSPWVGFKHFNILFTDPYFYKVLWNTIIINIYNITFGFIFTITLALFLNEIRISTFKKAFQTTVYMPNFLSWVVFSGLITMVLSPSGGILNKIISVLGGEEIYFLIEPKYFRAILVSSSIIKSAGFGTIIYLAAIAGINTELYDAAIIDGAHRGQLMRYITFQRIKPTIAVLLILSVAGIFGSNFEQVYTLYSPLVYDTGDVLSTYLYRTGLIDGRFEMATAIGLVFNIIGLILIITTNKFIEKMNVMGIF